MDVTRRLQKTGIAGTAGCRRTYNGHKFAVRAVPEMAIFLLFVLRLQIVSRDLFFADFEDGEECFLGDVDFADALHALLSFFLLIE